MKSHTWMWTAVVSLFAIAMPICMAAQDTPSQNLNPKHHQYKLIDLGTFGGPASIVPSFSLVSINSRGSAIVEADTPTADPFYPNRFNDCFVNHPGIWQDSGLTELGPLLDLTNSSVQLWVDERGVVIGVSENGLIDPLTGFPEVDAVVWKHGQITDLGTL